MYVYLYIYIHTNAFLYIKNVMYSFINIYTKCIPLYKECNVFVYIHQGDFQLVVEINNTLYDEPNSIYI